MNQGTAYKLLKEIAESDNDLVYRIMGDFGLGLKNFINSADLTHPELNSIFEEFYSEDTLFLNRCFEFIRTIKYASQNGYSSSANVFEEKLNLLFKGRLLNKMSNIKLLRSPSQREEMRSLKKCKTINLNFAYSRDKFWCEYPDSFSSYERYSSFYENEIVEVLKKRDLYQNLGCSSLAEEADRDLKGIKQSNEMYYGYHQIKSPSAAIILAKVLNFSFSKDGIFVSNDSALLKYHPFVCPINEIADLIPSEVVEKVMCLENLPEADGKPIFDLFALVVPTCCNGNTFAEKDYKNVLSFYIKNKIFKSILVGEKSNKFYFIDLVF